MALAAPAFAGQDRMKVFGARSPLSRRAPLAAPLAAALATVMFCAACAQPGEGGRLLGASSNQMPRKGANDATGKTSVESVSNSVGNSMASFDPKQIAKSDMDRMADVHRHELFASVRILAEKLYRRNPREWRKGGHASLEAALDQLLDPRTGWRSTELGDKRGTDAILLALRPDFTGDRVAALILGTGGMINAAFEEKTEFFMSDTLVPQKLYNSARNLEIAAWRLSTARDAAGGLLLLTNEVATATDPANLSFEREFGKMIGGLDLLARLIAERDHRTIARVVQNVMTAIFLPVAALR